MITHVGVMRIRRLFNKFWGIGYVSIILIQHDLKVLRSIMICGPATAVGSYNGHDGDEDKVIG